MPLERDDILDAVIILHFLSIVYFITNFKTPIRLHSWYIFVIYFFFLYFSDHFCGKNGYSVEHPIFNMDPNRWSSSYNIQDIVNQYIWYLSGPNQSTGHCSKVPSVEQYRSVNKISKTTYWNQRKHFRIDYSACHIKFHLKSTSFIIISKECNTLFFIIQNRL